MRRGERVCARTGGLQDAEQKLARKHFAACLAGLCEQARLHIRGCLRAPARSTVFSQIFIVERLQTVGHPVASILW